MGGKGTCPGCKKLTDLTEHHDKEICEKVLICRDCHDVLENYIKIIEEIRNSPEHVNQDSSVQKENING